MDYISYYACDYNRVKYGAGRWILLSTLSVILSNILRETK